MVTIHTYMDRNKMDNIKRSTFVTNIMRLQNVTVKINEDIKPYQSTVKTFEIHTLNDEIYDISEGDIKALYTLLKEVFENE